LPVSLNAAIYGLKFSFEVTLGEPELTTRKPPVRAPRTPGTLASRRVETAGWRKAPSAEGAGNCARIVLAAHRHRQLHIWA